LDKGLLEQKIVAKLKTIFDPEIPVDIYDLGLIYEIKIDDDANIYVKMTLHHQLVRLRVVYHPKLKRKLKVLMMLMRLW
jgi:metal-sulfur cluster biosynthetic enzyme